MTKTLKKNQTKTKRKTKSRSNREERVVHRKTFDRLRLSFYKALEPPEKLSVSQWADRYRILPGTASSEEGRWRTSRFPFAKEIMDVMSPDDPHLEVVFMGGSQISKTEQALNTAGYYMDYDPCPMLYVQKTIEAVERFSRQRLKPSLMAMPRLRRKLSDRKRDGNNAVRLISYPGGNLIMGGANSAASLRSMPIRILLLDEIDSFELDIQEEGDPVKLAVKRTSNFPNRKIFYISTPNVRETSRIEPLFLRGDQRYYEVPCPFCGAYQVIRWKNIHWELDEHQDPINIHLECEHCNEKIGENNKTAMLEAGKWVPVCPGRRIASFHLSALYSPVGFYSWEDAIIEFLEGDRENNNEKRKVWTNTVLGETWTMAGRTIEHSWVEKRKESYSSDVPADALVLTCGVDVQDDRIEAEVVGFGKDQQSWGIEYKRFMGNTEQAQVWKDLDDFLLKTYKHESGATMNIACTCIDSGFRTRVVYNFCRLREFRNIFSTKGMGGWGRGLIDRPKARNKDGVWLFICYADELKSKIYNQLRIEDKGPGFCHFPKDKTCYDENYFRMLVSERLVVKRVLGRNKLQWELPPGRQNEALDARGLSIAALNIISPNFDILQVRGPMAISMIPKTTKGRVISKGVE